MNEGFKKYYRIGQKSTRFACKNYKNLLNYYAFLIMQVIACVAIIPIPMMILAKVKMAKKVRYEQTINSVNLFSIKNKHGFKQLWLTIILLILHYLSRVILILLAGGFCSLIGLTISYYVNQGGSTNTKDIISLVIMIIMTLPAVIIYLIYTIYFVLSMAPIAFIIASSENMTVSQAIQSSFQATKHAKGTIFLIAFVYSLIYLVTIGVVAGGVYVCMSYINSLYLQIIIYFILALIGFYIILRFKMSNNVTKYSLFEDLVRNTATEKIVNHIKFSRVKGNYKNAEKNKLQMFDNLNAFDESQVQPQETQPIEKHEQLISVEVSKEAPQEEATPVEETPVEEAIEESPAEEPVEDIEEASQEEATPVEETPVEEAIEESPAEESVEGVEEVSQEEATPVEEAPVEEVTEESPAEEPVEDIEEASKEEATSVEEAPVEEAIEESSAEESVEDSKETPEALSSVEVQEEMPSNGEAQEDVTKPKRGRKPKAVKTEADVQEEEPKPKRGRKPKTVEADEASPDTPKKTVRKTSTRTKKSEVDSSDDTKEDK